jgi:hypothetical protein
VHHNLISPHVNPSPLQKESFGFYKNIKPKARRDRASHFHKTKVETNHAYHFWLMEVYPPMTLSDSRLEHAENIKPNLKRQHLFAILINYSFLGVTNGGVGMKTPNKMKGLMSS